MFRVIKESEWKKSNWSGGETNEIFIYPEGSSYKDRDFRVRISVATSDDAEKKEFTYLAGTNRFISKLDGDLYISHYGRYETDLDLYEIERFSGDWRTSSYGKYKDFNLILKDIRGDLCYSEINEDLTLNMQDGACLTFIFVLEGDLFVEDEEIELTKFDLLVSDFQKFHLKSKNAKIFYGFAKEWEQ